MFGRLPQDIVEHIAYYASTHSSLGPPSGLIPLLVLCRSTNAILCRASNPHLYARIFAANFDLAAPRRRLARMHGQDYLSVIPANALSDELVRRFAILKRIHHELDARSPSEANLTRYDHVATNTEADARLDEVLWTAFLMVLEDEGRNTGQLRHARIESWLAVFWFDGHGASDAIRRLTADRWPVTPAYAVDTRHKTRHSLGMWLLWFFLNPAGYVANPDLYHRAENMLKLVALNAPLYPLTHLPWTSFHPEPSQIHLGAPGSPTSAPFRLANGVDAQQQHLIADRIPHFTYFGHWPPQLTPLPPAVPAILTLLALHARSRRNADTLEGGLELLELLGPSLAEPFIALPEQRPVAEGGLMQVSPHHQTAGTLDTSSLNGQSKPNELPTFTDSYRWEYEWSRCLHAVDQNGTPINAASDVTAGRKITDTRKYKTYQPGSLDGSWEGPFTYTEFHSFAALLAGAWPSKLQDCLIAQHNQTWKLREYHLLAPSSATPQAKGSPSNPMPMPLPVGQAILAHIPEDVSVVDDLSTLLVNLPSSFSPPPSSSLNTTGPFPSLYTYTRYRGPGSTASQRATGDETGDAVRDWEEYANRVVDVLLSGEGHSGWGEFRILGRVRPADGFISVMKEYTGGDRGRWLYRGYLIGGASRSLDGKHVNIDENVECGVSKGYIVGRWRDMLTPAETHGYEGAFAMARRG